MLAIGFGIAVVLPALVHFGVKTFHPEPKYDDYQVENYYEKSEHGTTAEKEKVEAEHKKLEAEYKKKEAEFEKVLFMAAVPVGLAAIIIGAIVSLPAVGTGLIFGGIFTATDGYTWYWSELHDWMKALSLLIVFIVLLVIGHMKFRGLSEEKAPVKKKSR